jgi:hypothetical protein
MLDPAAVRCTSHPSLPWGLPDLTTTDGLQRCLPFGADSATFARMANDDSLRGAPMETAPRDGTLVKVWLKASEQGPAQVDVVRWARSARSGDGAWVASDSDQEARVAYSDGDLECWLPLPTQERAPRRTPEAEVEMDTDAGEVDGGGI